MFSIGQTVIYGTDGVCTVNGTTWRQCNAGNREYYVLVPVHDQKTTIYVPVDSEALILKIRSVVTPEEIDVLINEVSGQRAEWIADDAVRKEFCDGVIKSGDRKALMMLIEMLYLRREEQKANKRRFQIADDNFLKRAEKLLNDEFAYVLGIERDEVPRYIVGKITALRGE